MQMQEKKCKLAVLIAVVLFPVVFALLGTHVRYGDVFEVIKAIPVVGLIVSYNFPPADYYDARIDEPLLTRATAIPFSCHYSGRYEIDVVGYDGSHLDESGVGLHVQVLSNKGHLIYENVCSNSVALSTYDNEDRPYLRFCYFILDLPNDLPLDEPLCLSYDCFGQYESFMTENPQARIVIQKFFDK